VAFKQVLNVHMAHQQNQFKPKTPYFSGLYVDYRDHKWCQGEKWDEKLNTVQLLLRVEESMGTKR